MQALQCKKSSSESEEAKGCGQDYRHVSRTMFPISIEAIAGVYIYCQRYFD
jgi:hypothetical protein